MSHHSGQSVLVVEDDHDVRGALTTLLETHGYRVVEAENGRQALQHLRETIVCLILLDLFMPEMNGWAFRAEQMKDARLAGIPVVVISADSSAAQRAVTPGVVAAMTKPIEFDRLLQILGQHC